MLTTRTNIQKNNPHAQLHITFFLYIQNKQYTFSFTFQAFQVYTVDALD